MNKTANLINQCTKCFSQHTLELLWEQTASPVAEPGREKGPTNFGFVKKFWLYSAFCFCTTNLKVDLLPKYF